MNHDMSGMGGMGGMGGSGMDGDKKPGCKMNMEMLFNWDVMNTCFLTPSWHITDSGKFGGTCVGIFFWVMLTEMIRRFAREYDRYIVASATTRLAQQLDGNPSIVDSYVNQSRSLEKDAVPISSQSGPNERGLLRGIDPWPIRLRPTLLQQIIRSLLYGVQFTSAYLIMMIAMSFNAYVFICIMLGAFFGYLLSSWDTLGTFSLNSSAESTAPCHPGGPSAAPIINIRSAYSTGAAPRVNLEQKLPLTQDIHVVES